MVMLYVEVHKGCEYMSLLKDLTGQHFGMLTVLYRAKKDYPVVYWTCQCECGKIIDVAANNLTRGHTKSCGCQRTNKYIGQKFGMLTVLEKTKEFVVHGGQKSPLWKCQCDCGNITLVRLDSLTSGSTKSCGCHVEEKIEKMRKAAGYTEGTQLSRIRDIPQTSNNSSGVVGVYYDKRRGQWRARLRFKGVTYQLGYFSNLEDAVSARKEAEKSIFGEFLASLNLKESEKNEE